LKFNEQKKIIEFIKLSTITKEDLIRYSEVSGDHNKIHLEDKVAKQHNLPGVIAHGMLIAGFISSRATSFIEFEHYNYKIKKSSFRFKAMSFPGEDIYIGGECSLLNDSNLYLELEAKNKEGEVKTTAEFIYCLSI